jgi:hypothetical protein
MNASRNTLDFPFPIPTAKQILNNSHCSVKKQSTSFVNHTQTRSGVSLAEGNTEFTVLTLSFSFAIQKCVRDDRNSLC